MIDIFEADSRKFQKRLDAVRSRLFDWKDLAAGKGYKKTSKKVFGKILEPDQAVRAIIQNIRKNGDKALLRYTKEFDGIKLKADEIQVKPAELLNAYKEVSPAFRKALRSGIRNVTAFQKKLLRNKPVMKDIHCSRRNVPLASAGIYIPGGAGGETPLSSSVYMNVLPAKVAGVTDITVCTPPGPEGRISPFILTALAACGIEKVYKAGGAQAIAAMAYGTQTIPASDLVAGPGNLFVMLAKKEVMGQTGIDLLAGPSEILIIADSKADPAFIAADMLAQAEHDPMASSFLISTAKNIALKVKEEISKQIKGLTRRDIIKASLKKYGGIVLAKSLKEAVSIANRMAPEHLAIMTEAPQKVSKSISNAGTIFLGAYAPEAIGDYIAGPSHTLPTGGTARFFSGLSVDTFMKKTSIIYFPKQHFKRVAQDAMELARSEGLDGHRNSLQLRGS